MLKRSFSVISALIFGIFACLPALAFAGGNAAPSGEGLPESTSDINNAPVDKTDLGSLIDQAHSELADTAISSDGSDVPATSYWTTQEQQNALQAAISAAQSVYLDPAATQEQVVAAQSSLADALGSFSSGRLQGSFVPEADKSALSVWLSAAEDALRKTDVSPDGSDVAITSCWTTQAERDELLTIVKVSWDVYTDKNATQDWITDVIVILRDALAKFNADRKPGAQEAIEPTATAKPVPSAQPTDNPPPGASAAPTPAESSEPEPSGSPLPPAQEIFEPRPDAPANTDSPVEIVANTEYAPGDPESAKSLVLGIPITYGNASSASQTGTSVADIEKYVRLTPGMPGSIRIAAADAAQEPLSPESPIATGMVVKAVADDGSAAASATIVVKGDLLGTGVMNISQLARGAQALAGTRPLTGVFLQAADMTGSSGDMTITDLVLMARMLADPRSLAN